MANLSLSKSALCPCGSGLKFKRCCLLKKSKYSADDGPRAFAPRQVFSDDPRLSAPTARPCGKLRAIQRISVRYTFPEPYGEAKVEYSFPVGHLIILEGGLVEPVEKLGVGVRFIMQHGEIATVTAIASPDWWEPLPLRPLKGKVYERRVVGRSERYGNAVLDVTFLGRTVTTTPDHLFYSASRRMYLPAGQLRVGELLATDDGRTALLESISPPRYGLVKLFNIEVEELHNYFVGGSRSAVQVHNGVPGAAGSGIPMPAEAQPGNGRSIGSRGFNERAHRQYAESLRDIVVATMTPTFVRADKRTFIAKDARRIDQDAVEIDFVEVGSASEKWSHIFYLSELRKKFGADEVRWILQKSGVTERDLEEAERTNESVLAPHAATPRDQPMPVELDRKYVETVLDAYLQAVLKLRDNDPRVSSGDWLTHSNDNDRFLHILNLLRVSEKAKSVGELGKMFLFNSLTALGSPGYKSAIKLFQDVMEWADDQYNSERAFDIIADRLKSMVLKRISKIQEERLGQIAPEFVQQQIDKSTEKAKEAIADAVVAKIKELVLANHRGQTFERDYPLKQAGGIGSGQLGGEVVKCYITIIKYDDDTFTVVISGDYEHDPTDFEKYYGADGKQFGSRFHFEYTQKIRLTDGTAILLGPSHLKIEDTASNGK